MRVVKGNRVGSKLQVEFAVLLLFLAALFGAYVRIYPVARAGFPLLDGGLFYTMVQDLMDAGFHLPMVTSYNHLTIPFAYPPLPFYMVGALHLLTGLNLLGIIQWLPLVFALSTVPAFYLLARELLESPIQAALATLIFALLPRSYEWIIMGGGVTRAPAALFLLLMTWAAYRAFYRQNWTAAFMAALFGGLVLLCHPERALHAAATGLLFWLWLDRTRSGALKALAIGAGALMLSSPWWLTVLMRCGIEPFILAAQAAGSRWLFWVPLLQLNFTDEVVPLVALLAVIGAFFCWKRGKGFLAIWFVLAFLVDPRSAPHVVPIQVSLLAAIFLSDFLLSERLWGSREGTIKNGQTLEWIIFGYLFVLMLYNVQSNLQFLERLVLSDADRRAAEWISYETPLDSHFLVLDRYETPTLSPLLEWFPALSERTNVVTIQGREWLPGQANFIPHMESYPGLFQCLDQDTACLDAWAEQNGEVFDYVYLSLQTPEGGRRISRLSDSLLASPQYHVVYEMTDVVIFERLP